MLEEPEKHLILNLNRLRTFEDARLEIVTYVEAKFGLRIRDSKPSNTRTRDNLIKGAKGAKGSYKGKTSKSGLSVPEKPKSQTSSETLESAQT